MSALLMKMNAHIQAIYLAPSAGAQMEALDHARVNVGTGIGAISGTTTGVGQFGVNVAENTSLTSSGAGSWVPTARRSTWKSPGSTM